MYVSGASAPGTLRTATVLETLPRQIGHWLPKVDGSPPHSSHKQRCLHGRQSRSRGPLRHITHFDSSTGAPSSRLSAETLRSWRRSHRSLQWCERKNFHMPSLPWSATPKHLEAL